MLMGCIDQRDTSVRSGGAGDALRIGEASRRGNRVSLVDPKGRVFKALGRRLPPLAMRPNTHPGASPRDAILAQGLENAVQPVIITREGS